MPVVLRQCFGTNGNVIRKSKEFMRRYMFGFGSGTWSIGIELYNVVTWARTSKMEYITDELHTLLVHNKRFINIKDVVLSKKFNHSLTILYYAGGDLWICILTVSIYRNRVGLYPHQIHK